MPRAVGCHVLRFPVPCLRRLPTLSLVLWLRNPEGQRSLIKILATGTSSLNSDSESGVAPANQTNLLKGPKRKVHEFRAHFCESWCVFFLWRTSALPPIGLATHSQRP